tara:strand:- start:234 stop:449 length:216 start_codon:yes stop_codon:yes gene_type:complete
MFQHEVSKQIVALTIDDAVLQSEIFADMETHEDDFAEHEMIDPISGKVVIVTTEEQHLSLEEMGFRANEEE